MPVQIAAVLRCRPSQMITRAMQAARGEEPRPVVEAPDPVEAFRSLPTDAQAGVPAIAGPGGKSLP
jgi:hypothetical protein